MLKKPELTLPAGSLQCALYAFKGGADAVYLGLKEFSARKNAVNFTFEDLRKLKQYCIANNKKFYITLNTLIQDTDINLLMQILKQVDYIECNGIIVQDLGVAELVKKYYPDIPLHASTQLAVHNAEGVKVLADLGFSRVVLSRELSFEEIKDIRRECPDIELKVFIHGAMCYGFSGLCMASQKLTGRSANCGECAQICRTWFSTENKPKEQVWCFSMKDLCLGTKIKKYADIGIDSLKVEGRMKNSEYVYNVARFYSSILNDDSAEQTEVLKDNMLTTFSRHTTEGFFNNFYMGSCNSKSMVSPDYPSHVGLKVGIIKKVMKNTALIHFEKPVAQRDGLLVLYRKQSVGFSLSYIESGKSFVSADSTETINFPSDKFTEIPQSGVFVYCTSRHNQNLELLNENLPMYKKKIDLQIEISDKILKVNQSEFPVEVQEARTASPIQDSLAQVFSASGKSYYCLDNLSVKNTSSYGNPFIPLSTLKQIRRDFYAALDKDFENDIIKPEKPQLQIKYCKPDNCFVFEPLEFVKQLVPEDRTDIVLNNVCQIAYAKEHPEKKYYLGYFLYAKNSWAYSLLNQIIPNLSGTAQTEEKDIPLFISRVCFRHHALGLPCVSCSKDNTFKIEQNGKHYKVLCKNCITKVYMVTP